ncbi:zinc finger AN1 and C2H2 domain-containing stress-associated protein 16 [Dendrobium catenatum]|uniref:Zinc finger AN1 and C2H2 domain-containing stress-associated protein 16 n=1 Tax=Dendrobium catenatum TaxID=906689 RepID=A0A2I0W930_9ASPA|nr:zinc finger AN1 and C2H2 domain-containing stress-associated protein 16 [Dendrobium catenatum]PKU72167.1 Zinc finger AN1 and C2H2 domain-containing stress-associated protein 16 [Dendrobium catenatum]
MGTPALPSLGKHCCVEDCKLIDFLPFNCDRCNQVFCLQHKSYTKHPCPLTNQIDVTVLICPLCAQRVHLHPNEDPNITWDIHVNCECDPSNYQNATKKKLCPVPGCKEPLAFSNTIRCKDCTLEHCLRHRFALDHECSGPKKSETGFSFISVLRRSLKRELTPIQSSNGSVKWCLNLRNSALNLRASAEAGMQKLSAATNHALQKAKEGFGAGGQLVEHCLQCPARFSNVNALIDHVEKVHEDAVQKACAVVTIDICPLCSKAFRDPVLLVEHVENHENATS